MSAPTPHRWERIKQIFEVASARTGLDRAAYLDDACAADEDLRREVDYLLAHQEPARDFLEDPIVRFLDVRLNSNQSRQDAQLHEEIERLLPTHERAAGSLAKPVPANVRQTLSLDGRAPAVVRPDEALTVDSEFRPTDRFAALLRKNAMDVGRPAVLPVGARLLSGRLSIVRHIGDGGMGAVYEAFDTQRHCTIALKTLTRVDAASIYQLKNEFRGLADVRHEHLVKLYELFSDRDKWFFTMELVAGEPFDRWVRPGDGLNEVRLRESLRQLVAAVSEIHVAGKLHRDLKPNNVLVTPEGHLVVLDFGLAIDRDLGGIGQTIPDSRVFGTPAYMPPEQANRLATPASDWYAVGVMLFEALTGRLPFEGSLLEILAAKQRAAAPLASALTPDVPADLDALCAKLLAREPAGRPDVAELRARLGVPLTISEPPPETLVCASPDVLNLIGRAAELETLRDAFGASCASSKPVIVLLSGESGIGKSALCEVLLAELRILRHAIVLSGRCFERESVPFKGFDMVVDALSRHLRRLPEREVLTVLPRETYALGCLFPVLGRVAAIAEAPAREVDDPHELRRRAFLAFGELLGRIRDRQPLVLHLDDWQWSDTESTLLLTHLVRQADAPRLLILVSHRTEQMQGHAQLSPLYEALSSDIRLDVRPLRLGPLSAEAAQALLRTQVGAVPESFAREAGGNPFLLGEIGRYVQSHAHEVPTKISVEDVIAARVAGLPELHRRFVQVLAMAARPIDLLVAAEAAEVTASPRAVFEALRDAHLARATGHGGLVECYHDKVREALLGRLTDDECREQHLALARALAGRSDADAEQLAAHWLGAGEDERAARQFVRAADHASTELAFDRAALLYARALEHGRFNTGELQRLRVAHADALAEAGRGRESAEAYVAAMQHTSGEAQYALEHRAADQYLYSGSLAQGRAVLTRSLARRRVRLHSNHFAALASLVLERARLRWRGLSFCERLTDPALSEQLASLQNSARALGRLDFVGGAVLSARYLRSALDAGDTAHVAIGLQMEIWHRTLGIGDADDVAMLVARAEALLSRTDAFKARCWMHFCRGFYQYYRPAPDLKAAIEDFDQFLELTQERHYKNASYDRRMAEHNRMNARVQLGRLVEVARGLPSLLDDAFGRGDFVVLPFLAGENGALALIAVGAIDDAQHELDRALRAWSSCRNPYTFQDCFLLAGSTYLTHARGEVRPAWQRARRDLERFWASPLRSSQPMAGTVRMSAASAALALAASTDGSERAALLLEASKLAKGVTRHVMSGPVQAALAWLRSEPETAISILRKAFAEVQDRGFPLHAHMIRRRLGELVGGDEGKALLADADTFLRAAGAITPAHLAATCVMPGIELSQP